ncbi:MAG TPA: 7-carboxy-7-deazaguanine synthase QueE [Candidatus Omnitrophota bacterium]|nr:7-carboxy-7-deazaguanine synthase QueE [Candidatus Omnitrophota bacterium]
MKAKVLEIFQSIQGEGKYAGIKQVFVRFFECNMHCVWCDTPNSIGDTVRNFKEMTLDEIMDRVRALKAGCESVSLTGGEPLLQAEFIKGMLPALKKEGLKSYLETNGVLPQALGMVIDGIDTIAMDIKLPSSTKCQPFWKEHESFLKLARQKDVFIKTVISSDTDKEDIGRCVQLVAGIDPDVLFILQPNTYELKNGVMKKCLEFQDLCLKRLNNVRILPQVHKFMKLR